MPKKNENFFDILGNQVRNVKFDLFSDKPFKKVDFSMDILNLAPQGKTVFSVDYRTLVMYGKSASVQVTGSILLSSPLSKKILDSWKKENQVPDEYAPHIMNIIYMNSIPIIASVSALSGFPPITLPPVIIQKTKQKA